MKIFAKLPLDGKIVSSNLKVVGGEQSRASINVLDMCGIICVKNLKFEQLLMRCEHLVNLFFPLSCNNNIRLLYYLKPITPPLYLSVC